MSDNRIGLWMIGAHGGIATTVAVGLAALTKGLVDEAGLVSSRPQFAGLGLADWSRFVLGGHEIRETTAAAEAAVLHSKSRVFSDNLLEVVDDDLNALDGRVRPGTLLNVGKTIATFGGPKVKAFSSESPAAAIARLRADLEAFRKSEHLDSVIVVNISSTEPPVSQLPVGKKPLAEMTWAELSAAVSVSTAEDCPIAASTLYAIAAMEAGCDYVNFTPSIGSDLPALDQLARLQGVTHSGRDGKTGETLMKAVLAPMFAARNLPVMSWGGHNILGHMDGKVRDDPINKPNKVRSKHHLLTEILGYKPTSLVTIEYIEDMADWKTAWDHIHFRGFLDTQMTLQFTWQGCDSLLAAPLVLDLVRFTERARRSGDTGVLTHLASFFKSPMGERVPPEFARQYDLLEQWARK